MGSQQSRHLPLRVAELGGEVGHQLGVVEEGGGEVEEGVGVRRGVTVLTRVETL